MPNTNNSKSFQHIIPTLIFSYYLITRLYIAVNHMNEYFDYDEGTYLMIARLINQGFLPYRDIFAVHPPLYYYVLALWLRIFGDSYVVGRLLSVFLGFLSLIVAYYAGKELRNWKLGVIFSGLLAMDPLLIHFNSLVFHETSIEFFTLLSLFYFIKYFKTTNPKYAYISLFWAAVGSTLKFTIIPYTLALYLIFIFSLDKITWGYIKSASNILLNKIQVFILLLAYLWMTIIATAVLVGYPLDIIRKIMIVPGIHKIELVGHIYPSIIFLVIWGALTIYILNITYVSKLIYLTKTLFKNLKTEFKLATAIILPKLIIEGILGIGVSESYISQTYLVQGGRYPPILNFFSLIGGVIDNIISSKLELLVFYTPTFILIAWALLLTMQKNSKINYWVNSLFLANFFIYFFVSPGIANPRFLYPMILVLYLLLLDVIFNLNITRRQLGAVVLSSIAILGVINFGMLYWYPKGDLKLAWAPHTKELRDDLTAYLEKNPQNGTYLSINPMNAYYLDLPIPPYYVDTFGLTYLLNPNLTIKAFNKSDYLILSTWSYQIMEKAFIFKETYGKIEKYLTFNGTLLFSESYFKGDVLHLFKKDGKEKTVTFDSFFGKMRLWAKNESIGYLYTITGNKSFNYKTKIEYVTSRYIIKQWSENGSYITFYSILTSNSIELRFYNQTDIVLSFSKPVVVLNNGKFAEPKDIDEFTIYIANTALNITLLNGKLNKINEKRIIISCNELKMTLKE